MKRGLILSVALVAVLVTAAGCSSAGSTPGASATANSSSFNNGQRRPDFGQPQTPPDLRGLVTSIVGNQVTLLKLPSVENRRNASGTGANGSSSSTANGGRSGGPQISLGAGGGGRVFFGGRPGGAGGSATDRATMIANLEKLSTGSETVTIPVGIKMMKFAMDSATNRRTAVEATLNDITADSMITVWLDHSATGSPVANFVLISGSTGAAGSGGVPAGGSGPIGG